MNPKITVAMPVYNGAAYLVEAIESVLRQDFSSFELIICDDGSTDRSYAIAVSYSKKDPRIKLIRNLRNKGAAAARNRIMRCARGEYFAPHDADDIMLAGRLSKQVKILDKYPEVGVVFGHVLVMRQDWNGKARPVFGSAMTAKGIRRLKYTGLIKTFCFVAHCASMFRTSLAKAVGGYAEAFDIGEDRILFRKLWGRTGFFCLNEPMYVHRLHRKSLTAPCRNRHGIFSNAKLVKCLPRPRITVAIPVYNNARYLSECLESVLRQDYENFEVIIYDDGSSDGSRKIAKMFQRMDPRVRVYGSRTNRGVAFARNRILKLARGKYVALQDGDDLMLASRLKNQGRVLDENPRAGLVFGHNFVIQGQKRLIDGRMIAFVFRGNKEHRLTRSGFIRAKCWFPTGSAMFRKALAFQAGGYDQTMKAGSDQEIYQRMKNKTGFYFLDNFTYVYRRHRESLTATHKRLVEIEKRRRERLRRERFNRIKRRLAFNWHGGQVEIFSEREHYLKIIQKYLSYYTSHYHPLQKGPFKKIRIEVRYRDGHEPGIQDEIISVENFRKNRKVNFFIPDGPLKMFIHKNYKLPDSRFYHGLFLNPVHKMIRKFGAILMHGALLGEKKSGILIIGQSGAGKSTLSALLAMEGVPYFSDEHAVLHQKNGRIRGLSFANDIGIIPEAKTHFRDSGYPIKWNKGTGKFIFRPWESKSGHVGDQCDIKTLLFPKFIPGEQFNVTPLSRQQVFKKLMKDEYVPADTAGPGSRFHYELFQTLAGQARGFAIRYGERHVKSVIQWVLDRERRKNG